MVETGRGGRYPPAPQFFSERRAVASTIQTRYEPFTRLLATNDTTAGTSIADPADTLTDPTGTTGVINLLGNPAGPDVANGLELIPYGVGTATNTFLLSLYAIAKIAPASGVGPAWTYKLLCSFTCTLCTKAGIANSPVNASQLYCGTITLSVGNANVSNEIISPTGNNGASIRLDNVGAGLVKPVFAMNNSATSANALYRRI